MEFRKLRADEIEVRVARINSKFVSLLLYKDARCDMNILDETVGAMNWMREHRRDNANCIVSLWDADKEQWISKEDTGTESNTEAQKGLASDSFKRACFNWGLGRELYTSPRIDFPAQSVNISANKTYDRFEVTHIAYEDNKISELLIKDINTGVTLNPFNNEVNGELENPNPATQKQRDLINKLAKEKEISKEDFAKIKEELSIGNTDDMTKTKANMLIERLKNE